ncbi:bifunctional adenosylcobinamide kinase/adenosylcobinamide-phosphate guanylyltransferase [Parageobacillus thermoglucosidasius]|uniref:Bifunctional adenosylcobinamide kinase/adenosylcobinamide-phosphate guanylyltransferase n=1 Tax=Parageobacillus thermoglucosidasius TaxID=1426 RepID=A0AB38QXL4_PARTM|nr:hypothetical protein Geoth_1406 [Parageobacillus thermoglucosidasius C56-YS93]UOE75227.1 bifunctional adenosylcobinamide kinase/adenosylcobinamide-phosphate guanylyltransferase [Parageobacillus thermoglucosidasius]
MHFIVGGAFQGKRKWARAYYRVEGRKDVVWCNGYEREYGEPDVNIRERIVVFEGLEAAIRRIPDVAHWKRMFRIWHEWEQQGAGRTVVWIGSDITQGIVPVEKEERLWRDVTGWCYQQLAQLCDRVDRVWCGLAERMK